MFNVTIQVKVAGQLVQIPISEKEKADFNHLFVRTNPTPAQRKKYKTLMNLLGVAYHYGLERGRKGFQT
jgi:hypothetical protein